MDKNTAIYTRTLSESFFCLTEKGAIKLQAALWTIVTTNGTQPAIDEITRRRVGLGWRVELWLATDRG